MTQDSGVGVELRQFISFKERRMKMIKKFLKRGMAVALAVSLVTGLMQTGFSPGKEAKAAGSDIVVGSTYSFGGYDWIAAEDKGDWVVLQSKGVTSGYWPGYKLWGRNNNYRRDIDGRDISEYDEKTQKLYNDIKYAEYKGAEDGSSGLYLVSNSKAGATYDGDRGSGYYWQALKEAAVRYDSLGTDYHYVWLGTVSSSSTAWCVSSSGDVYCNHGQGNSRGVAPAFNLDKSKVTVSGYNINIKHSLSYDVATNGGTSTKPSSIEVDPDTVFDTSSGVFEKTAEKQGWTFVGWNTDKDAHTGLTSLIMDSDKTLYAIFKKNLTITFKDVGN